MSMLGEKILRRLRVLAAVMVVAVVAVAACVAVTPERAWAAEYRTEPYMDGDIKPQDDNNIAPGFRWVPQDGENPAHYEIYNPVGTEWADSHEASAGWWYFAYYSKTHDFDGYLIQLAEDINFVNYEWDRDVNAGRTQLTVGRDEDLPFKGTFDGQGHTLYNLDNPREDLWIDLNCGFFGYTKDAVVKNINFVNYEWDRDVNSGRTQLTVGRDKDLPFKGTFDGQGHTLYNLDNPREDLWIDLNCGFFGYTDRAVVKNINFYNCYVGSSYNGALVVGDATDTLIMNVTATKCTASVIPPNNVINLITNAGMSGGMIVGNANGSTLYNCEMRGGTVVTNATAGVGALGGQPLYLGGLVGYANDTIIEYSRVADYKEEDGTYTPAYVKNQYGTAVSVANFSEIFTGGIVGAMRAEDSGSKIVDCYCTADVYSEACIYFGVGLGLGVTRGYTGGIAGMVRTGAKDGNDTELNLIERVSFAGNLHSYNYNIILLGIPAIERDKYMGGITGRGGENATIADAYYMRYRNNTQGERSIWGSTTDEDIYDYKTSYDGGVNDGVNFGYRDDQYTDRNFWESCGFDFAENKLRNLGYTFTDAAKDSEWSANHYNKWIMDYDRGIPVHGGSIKATLDCPGSGTTYIGYTSMTSKPSTVTDDSQTEPPAQSTDNPYDFAVQGFQEGVGQTSLSGDKVTHADLDNTIRLTFNLATEAPDNSSWASDDRNGGYRFMGWYRSRDVRVNDIAENHDLFTTPNSTLNTETNAEGLISDEYEVQKNDSYEPDSYTLDVNKPVTDEGTGEKTDYYDNDLYLAYTQANVLLHDVSGNIIKCDGSATQNGATEDDWYDYDDTLTLPTAVTPDATVTAGGAVLIGWTTKANANSTGYAEIDSQTLTSLKNDNQFWAPGDDYTVTAPANLYPVYSKYSNIEVIYEGHDVANDLTTRTGYGTAVKSTDGSVRLTVCPAEDDSPLIDGMVRFLGWYEYIGDAEDAVAADADSNATHWVRVSRGEQLPEGDSPQVGQDCFTYDLTEDGVDLTVRHIYKARFEYRVDYWAPEGADTHAAWTEYSTVWHTYNQPFQNIGGPGEGDREFLHWAKYSLSDDATGPWACTNSSDAITSENTKITAPLKVMAHIANKGTSGREITLTTDFPTGPEAYPSKSNSHLKVNIRTDNLDGNGTDTGKGFVFYGWTGDGSGIGDPYAKTESTDNPWDLGLISNFWATSTANWYEAHVTARVRFHGVPEDNSFKTKQVERTYDEEVFRDTEQTNTYTYHYHNEASKLQSSTSAAFSFDTNMDRNGYIFLGWVNHSDEDVKVALDNNLVVEGTIDNGGEAYLAKGYKAVAPYLMTGEEHCYGSMEIYPVYVETFDLATTTNVKEAGVDTETYNIPADPVISDGKIDGSIDTVKVSYNSSQTVELSYNQRIQAEVEISADNNTKIWNAGNAPEGKEEELYQLLSLSVIKDGVEIATIPVTDATEGSDGATMVFSTGIPSIEAAGASYVFRANYSPVPVQVIYHLNDTETNLHETNVGDLLPNTTEAPSFSGYEDYFFMGWVVGDANGSVKVWNGAEEIDFAEPGVDTVTGTTHLWPVYRQGNVFVDSNIDNEIENEEQIRYTEVRGDSLYLVAKDVDGYRFEGWYTNYQDQNAREQLTSAYEYPLRGDARFDGTTYTAVYTDMAKVNQVQYHDTEGKVIYTAYAEGTDENRTFLRKETVNVPEVDPDTGETTFKQEEQWVIIDLDAFNIINAELNEANSVPGAGAYEEFVTWQWVDNGENTPERWGKDENDTGNFINEPVSSNVGAEDSSDHVMHLYPVTLKLTATAPNDGTASGSETVSYLDGLKVTGLNRNDETDQLESANVTLLSDYTKGWLKVNLTEYAYNAGDGTSPVTSTSNPQENVAVNLYAAQSAVGSPLATATTVANAVTGQDPVDLAAGDALFVFNGRLVINKSADEATDGQAFTFKVTDSNNNTRLVPVTVHEVTDADGKVTGYTGSSRLILPYGTYTVAEDDWAWRYESTLTADGGTTTSDSIKVEVSYKGIASDGSPAATEVDCTNTLDPDLGDKWFDDDEIVHNVFDGKGGE